METVSAATGDIVTTSRLVWALIVPLIGSFLVSLSGKKPNLRESFSIVSAVILFGMVFSMVSPVLAGKTFYYQLFKILPGVTVTLRADAFSMIFALVASSLWIAAAFYSMGYMRGLHEHAQTRFNTCFAIAIFGAIGVAFSDNLFTLYLFFCLSVPSFMRWSVSAPTRWLPTIRMKRPMKAPRNISFT